MYISELFTNKNQIYNKTILIRMDLNVPYLKGKIQDETRIKKLLPSIKNLLKNGVRVTILISLEDVVEQLQSILG